MRNYIHSETETIPALGHDFVQTKTPPTCTEDGVINYNCSRCSEQRVEPGEPALSHDYIGDIVRHPTCIESGLRVYACSLCGENGHTENIPALGHNLSGWNEQTPPQEGIDGSEVRACLHCEHLEIRVIPALPTIYVPEPPPSINTFDIAIYSFNFLFLLFGVVFLFPGIQAVYRVKKFWKQYLKIKNAKEEVEQ